MCGTVDADEWNRVVSLLEPREELARTEWALHETRTPSRDSSSRLALVARRGGRAEVDVTLVHPIVRANGIDQEAK